MELTEYTRLINKYIKRRFTSQNSLNQHENVQ